MPASRVLEVRAADLAGCGAHVEQVLGRRAAGQRCRCREEKAKGDGFSKTSAGSPGSGACSASRSRTLFPEPGSYLA